MDTDSVSVFAAFLGAGLLALAAALLSALRDRSDRRRHDLDRISLVSWGLLSVLFTMLAIILLATAAKLYFSPAPLFL
jgi:hypothetical protein